MHSFLEALRARFPESSEHMMTFVLRSYSFMQLLEETTAIGHCAVECAADLARYRSAIEEKDISDRLHWKEVAIRQTHRVSSLNPTVGHLYHHIGILSKGTYAASFFNMLKALTVSQPFPEAWSTVICTVLTQFVAPEGQTSTTLSQVLSLDEDNLYTAVSRLLLASAPPADLQKSRFDSSKDTHLLAFDRLLRLVAGLDDPKSTLHPKLLALFQMPMRPHTFGAVVNWTPSLVGPASRYVEPTRYVHEKMIKRPASHTIRGEYTNEENTTASSSTGLSGWVTDKFFRSSPKSEKVYVQNFSVRPRYVPKDLSHFHTNQLQPRTRSCALPVTTTGDRKSVV